MRNLPPAIIQVLRQFEPMFSERVWEWAKILLVGAILAPGKRTVTSALRVMGLSQERQFQNFHRVLNRATWSSHALSCVLLRLLVAAFVPAEAAIVVGIDDHIERRRGAKIAAKGIYRDAVRSSKSFFVKTSGLRWVCMMLLTPIPWAQRVWALPFLTVLAPSERYYAGRKQQHKQLTDWARQMLMQVRTWLPNRMLVVVADSTYAALELLASAQGLAQPVTIVTRLRLDAALYDPAPPRQAGQRGAPRKKGARQPNLAARVDDPTTVWTEQTIAWYGRKTRKVRLATGTALWYHSGMPPVALRWVLIADLEDADPLRHSRPRLCSALTAVRPQHKSSHGLSCAGSWKSPLRRRVPISASKPSASGPTWPFCARHQLCSASSRWSLSLLITCSKVSNLQPVKPPGTQRRSLPLPIPWPLCVNTFGPQI